MQENQLTQFLANAYGLQLTGDPQETAPDAFHKLQFTQTPAGIFSQIEAFRPTLGPSQNHPHKEQLIFKLVTRGNIRIRNASGEYWLPDGSLSLLTQQRNFEESFISPTSLLVIGCDSALCQRVLPLLRKSGGHSTTPEPQDFIWLQSLIRQYLSNHQFLSPGLSAISSQSIITTLCEMLLNGPQKNTNPQLARQRTISEIREFISDNLHDPALDGEMIAAHMRLSVNYMNRLLHSEQLSLMKWVWQLRLEEARRLLNSPAMQHLQLAEIAWNCGFASQSHFSHAFKKHFGISPKQMRTDGPQLSQLTQGHRPDRTLV
ncbi:helix-turn-helix transcriptional regulator [Tatumella citrea]|uniref:HTH araC/xylS-type domain-containing protein n=1 Tax=Tatumella citrea TaxID=53336 RepID=A0A1Y0LIX1_TATCI|nr:AraC family transcriptional regulator [Tatumella citrea]ARU93998.1 hypothetical protein A7K98_09545 [Tatumella citrea]ARU98036.1 hypothetical protein A7K99_09545 [Tatumella citrea]